MAATYRSRLTQVNQVAYDLVDIFQSDLFTRITGLTAADVTLTLMFNNGVLAWPLADGASISDSQVSSGTVYWDQLTNGSYGLRFVPNAVGHWNLWISYSSTTPSQIVGISIDVVSTPTTPDTGMMVNFCG